MCLSSAETGCTPTRMILTHTTFLALHCNVGATFDRPSFTYVEYLNFSLDGTLRR